ncbi:hypothetical protein TSUD_230330 [Trifolium subterraneum]|nr:hypothetical protein TSUD_230330 [Trifolium subterraneum]
MEQPQLLSKIATGNGHGENSPYFDGWKAYENDPFHPTNNPNGVIQMGLAENQALIQRLQFALLKECINSKPWLIYFQDYHGLPQFRQAVAKFMERTRGNRVCFDPDRIVMSGGATGAHEVTTFCLADPGDAFLVPTPYYAGFDRDLKWRTGVELVPVICKSSNNFKLTRKALEAAFEKAKEQNIKIKVFCHPSFTSIAEIIEDTNIECNCNLIHIVYSLSKDMGFPGFRVGIIYSYNDEVVNCARKMSSFGLVSSQTQYLIASMLSDDEFVDKFVVESAKRLAKRYGIFCRGLAQVGIKCLQSNAGLFLWMDLRCLLKKPTFDEEMKLWKVIIHQVKINISPGVSFHCSEPGWFRVCYANMDDNDVEVSLTRIRAFVRRNKAEMVAAKNRCSRRNLRISFSFRRLDDFLISPHSSITHSPIVKATTC